MTADVELLPLPEPECMGGNDVYGVEYPLYTSDHMQSYARTCVAHATAAKDAEIERLRTEVDRWKSSYNAAIELKGRAFAESDRLAEALRDALEYLHHHLPDEALAPHRAALRDHDQEGGNP